MAKVKESRKRVLLFYNPFSGNGFFKNHLDLMIERFQKAGLVVLPIRSSKDDILENTFRHMDQSEYVAVAVAGGDGTLNICVNAMIKHDVDLPLAIIPAGTANDFAYYFDLPQDINELLDIATGDKFTYADVGKLNNKYFVNVSAIGNLVDISQKTDPGLKNTLGVISYYLKGITEMTSLKSISIKITTEEKTIEEQIYFMVIMNGRSAGGFRRLCPHSSVNDGMLDVLAFKVMPIREFGPLLIDILQGGNWENKNVLHLKSSDFTVESPNEKLMADVDGEKGETFPLHFSVLPKKLKIFTKYDNMEGSKW